MESKGTIRKYNVPQDVVIDILRIVILNQIKYAIAGVMRRDNCLMLEVYYKPDDKHEQAQENIETILHDYESYMQGIMPDRPLLAGEEEWY